MCCEVRNTVIFARLSIFHMLIVVYPVFGWRVIQILYLQKKIFVDCRFHFVTVVLLIARQNAAPKFLCSDFSVAVGNRGLVRSVRSGPGLPFPFTVLATSERNIGWAARDCVTHRFWNQHRNSFSMCLVAALKFS